MYISESRGFRGDLRQESTHVQTLLMYSDPLFKVKEEQGFLPALLTIIPGYQLVQDYPVQPQPA